MEFSLKGSWLRLEPEGSDFEAEVDLCGFVQALRERVPRRLRRFQPNDGTWLVRPRYERVVDLLCFLYLTPWGVEARRRAELLGRLDALWPCTLGSGKAERGRSSVRSVVPARSF